MSSNNIARIGEDFKRELEDLKDNRQAYWHTKKRISTEKITNLLVKHVYWKQIKKEIIELDLRKRENGHQK